MGNPPHVPWAQACGRILELCMQASRDGIWWRGRAGRVCAGGALGGGIFALRRPRPYRRHGGEGDATLTIIYAHAGINRNGGWGDNDATRRAATSFEKLGE